MPPSPPSAWERFDAQNPMARARRRLDYASAIVVVLVGSWQWLAADSRDHGGLAARIVLLAAAWWLSILWHELGHATLARAAGLDPYVVLLGSGRSVLRVTLSGTTLDFGWFLGSGVTMLGPLQAGHQRVRVIVALAGGPVATLALLVGAAWFRFMCRAHGSVDGATTEWLRDVFAGNCADVPSAIGLAASALIVSNVLVLLTTATPRVRQAGILSLPSDLSAISGLLSGRNAEPLPVEGWSRQRGFARCLALRQYDEAEQRAVAILRAEPHRSRLRLDFAKMLFLVGRYVETAREFRALLGAGSGDVAVELASWLLAPFHAPEPSPSREVERRNLLALAAATLENARAATSSSSPNALPAQGDAEV